MPSPDSMASHVQVVEPSTQVASPKSHANRPSWLAALGVSWIQRATRSKPKWPDPLSSVGIPYEPLHSVPCWDVKGPVREIAELICPQATSVLELNHERLTEGEKCCPMLLIGMYMVGHCENEATPVLLVSCGKKSIRENAKALIKEMKILDAYPAVILAMNPKPPVCLVGSDSDPLQPNPVYEVGSGLSTYSAQYVMEPKRTVYSTHKTWTLLLASSIYFRKGSNPESSIDGKSTMGGLVCVNGILRGLTVAHGFTENNEAPSGCSSDSDIEYDCDDPEDTHYVELTSRG